MVAKGNRDPQRGEPGPEVAGWHSLPTLAWPRRFVANRGGTRYKPGWRGAAWIRRSASFLTTLLPRPLVVCTSLDYIMYQIDSILFKLRAKK